MAPEQGPTEKGEPLESWQYAEAAYRAGISISDFANATPGETLAYIKARQKAVKEESENEIFKLKVQRINTFQIMRSFGCEIDSEEMLYTLPGDTYKVLKPMDLKSEEMDKFFNDKFN